MKTGPVPSGAWPAPIVSAAGAGEPAQSGQEDPASLLDRARAFAEPLLAGRELDGGEPAWIHAHGVCKILGAIGAGPSMQAAVYLVYAGDALQRPQETIARAFGESFGGLVVLARRLMEIQRATRQGDAVLELDSRARRIERVRKMLLAFSKDLRVVLLRLASHLQTLRWHTAARTPCPAELARESMEVFAPLASRLGIWQIKWELEDLAFRLLQPAEYQAIARMFDQKRRERELALDFSRHQLEGVLRQAGVRARVEGRTKHLYSIWKKMQGKGLAFESVLDLRALRVIVDDVAACYAALSTVHARYRALPDEFDDYIARPKPNGYQSLHTVVRCDDGRPMEVQIRTAAMHDRAEQGVAAHWAYKEAGTRGYAGISVDPSAAANVAQARQAVMRQLLAWEREFVQAPGDLQAQEGTSVDDRIYVLTPQAEVAELPRGATPVDFAYSLHTDLGHRCRGARVDGALVPLNTALDNGQTVEIVVAKEGGPSLDWLNPELAYLASPRARAKVRAWFNLQAARQTIARGRELVEKLLQREGRTAMKLDDLAAQLGFDDAERLFEAVGKDEYSLRNLESLLRPAPQAPAAEEELPIRKSRAGDSGVLVVGVESLMTALSRCCRPAPPDAIGGFVTRGRGVAVHRASCTNFRHMAASMPDRVIPVQWGAGPAGGQGDATVYPLDVYVEAADRQGLLRDISEVFARERVNVTGVHTQTVRDAQGVRARMTFTVEASDSRRLAQVLRQVEGVPGVRLARRR